MGRPLCEVRKQAGFTQSGHSARVKVTYRPLPGAPQRTAGPFLDTMTQQGRRRGALRHMETLDVGSEIPPWRPAASGDSRAILSRAQPGPGVPPPHPPVVTGVCGCLFTLDTTVRCQSSRCAWSSFELLPRSLHPRTGTDCGQRMPLRFLNVTFPAHVSWHHASS